MSLIISALVGSLLLAAPPNSEIAGPRPSRTGSGLLVWGSTSIALGAAGIVGGTVLLWDLGDGGGILGAIPASFSVVFFGLGIPAVVIGSRRRAALRRWEAAGVNRPTRNGVGLMSLGGVSLTAGLCMSIPGFVWLPPVATYEPGDAPISMWSSITGTIGLVAGSTMIVMGAVQRHHARRRSSVDVVAVPWATPTSVGFGVSGRF